MKNLSMLDRSVRVWLGLSMIIGSFLNHDLLPWSMVGILLVATAWQGLCPFYAAIGLRTTSTT